MRDDGGKIIGTLSSGEDITVRKDAEAERKKLDLIKDDLIAIASHELKTPITSLVILVGTLKEKQIGELNPKQKEIVDLMLADTNRIQNLVSNMLDIARLEAGHMQYNFKRADIFEVIKKSLLSTTAMAKENGMKITVKGNGPILVKMDRMRIGQVVINLVSNAIKYSKSPGKIVISVSKKGKVLVVSIKDYGKGISKDKLDNLFTRKFQFESAKEHVAGGAGFGLYIARSIIEAHKGKIWVESKSGKGSTFIFSIPLSGGKK